MNIAIIITTYNGARWLPRAIASAQAQTYPPSEIIVVDDGSTDNTAALLGATPCIRAIIQPNAGVSAARNRGARESSGDWLLFLDYDDDLLPDALARFKDYAQAHPGFEIYYGGIAVERQGGRGWRMSGDPTSEGAIPAAALVNFYRVRILTPGAVLMRKSLLLAAGGWDTRYDSVEDQDLFIRAGAMTEFKYCGGTILRKNMHNANVSSNWQTTTLLGFRCTVEHLERFRQAGRAREFRGISAQKALDLAIRRALRYNDRELLDRLLKEAGKMGVLTLWAWLFRRSFRLGVAYARFWGLVGYYIPAVAERWRYGRLG